jgi:hypothetical protein
LTAPGCAALDRLTGNDNQDSQRIAAQRDVNAPVVPAVPPDDQQPVTPKPSPTISTGGAQPASGLRSTHAENQLTITSTSAAAEPAMPVQRLASVRQSQWTGDHLSYEQARDRLYARGVTWMQLEWRDGVWQLHCSIPNPQDPQKVRFYEAQAKDEISAMRAVLDKMGQP